MSNNYSCFILQIAHQAFLDNLLPNVDVNGSAIKIEKITKECHLGELYLYRCKRLWLS